jgi:putative SOS response-associated peptidase YedK
MCGRFVSSSTPQAIADFFGAELDVEPGAVLGASYNVAPTNDIYAVVQAPDGTRHVQIFHWGLVPVWAKDVKIGQRMINARAETLAEKNAFKGPLRKHRCLVPMDGFFEWRPGSPDGPLTAKGTPAKQPMYVTRIDGQPLAVAGLWSTWRDKAAGPDAPWLHSCTLITTDANATMAPIHDRMPVILPASAWSTWLDPGSDDLASLQGLLVPSADDLLEVRAVSTAVNNVRNKGPELIEPA